MTKMAKTARQERKTAEEQERPDERVRRYHAACKVEFQPFNQPHSQKKKSKMAKLQQAPKNTRNSSSHFKVQSKIDRDASACLLQELPRTGGNAFPRDHETPNLLLGVTVPRLIRWSVGFLRLAGVENGMGGQVDRLGLGHTPHDVVWGNARFALSRDCASAKPNRTKNPEISPSHLPLPSQFYPLPPQQNAAPAGQEVDKKGGQKKRHKKHTSK